MAKYGSKGGKGGKSYTSCTRTSSVPTQDASRKLKGPNVAKGACRESTAPYYGGQKLGPRNA